MRNKKLWKSNSSKSFHQLDYCVHYPFTMSVYNLRYQHNMYCPRVCMKLCCIPIAEWNVCMWEIRKLHGCQSSHFETELSVSWFDCCSFVCGHLQEKYTFHLHTSKIPLLQWIGALWIIKYIQKINIPKYLRQMKMGKLQWRMCFHHRYLYSVKWIQGVHMHNHLISIHAKEPSEKYYKWCTASNHTDVSRYRSHISYFCTIKNNAMKLLNTNAWNQAWDQWTRIAMQCSS
jgi:hypothetical protein